MERFTQTDLIIGGLSQINNNESGHLVVEYDSFNRFYPEQIEPYLKNLNYKLILSKNIGKDFEIGIAEWIKKTQEELDSENLDLQIKRIEKQFNITITYEKN